MVRSLGIFLRRAPVMVRKRAHSNRVIKPVRQRFDMNQATAGVTASRAGSEPAVPVWKQALASYQRPAVWPALWQLLNTLVPYAGLWYVMYLSLKVSVWLTAPLVVLAGAFLVRVFIIFHDCGHGSFFKSRLANDILGVATGLLCFTPYFRWRWEHAVHHATAGDLDRRGTGDV